MSVPAAMPSYVPAGRYLCRVADDPAEKASQFAEGKFYIELALQIQSERGEWFAFPLATTLKSPIYHEILRLCGGRLLESGITQPPETLIGKQFIAKIGERLSRDKKRTVNEVLQVLPYVSKKKPAPEELEEPTAEPEEPTDDEGGVVPF